METRHEALVNSVSLFIRRNDENWKGETFTVNSRCFLSNISLKQHSEQVGSSQRYFIASLLLKAYWAYGNMDLIGNKLVYFAFVPAFRVPVQTIHENWSRDRLCIEIKSCKKINVAYSKFAF